MNRLKYSIAQTNYNTAKWEVSEWLLLLKTYARLLNQFPTLCLISKEFNRVNLLHVRSVATASSRLKKLLKIDRWNLHLLQLKLLSNDEMKDIQVKLRSVLKKLEEIVDFEEIQEKETVLQNVLVKYLKYLNTLLQSNVNYEESA